MTLRNIWGHAVVTKIRKQQSPRKRGKALRAKSPTALRVAPRRAREAYERQIAERSPRMSADGRQFLAQMRADPGYRATMRDLADK